MKSTNLLIKISEMDGFLTLQSGFASYYPILNLNIEKYEEKRSHFLSLKAEYASQFNNEFNVNLWDKSADQKKCSFEYFGAKLEKALHAVHENVFEFVRKLDAPLLMLNECVDDKVVVYSTDRGIDAINTFFDKHSEFSRDDLHLVMI